MFIFLIIVDKILTQNSSCRLSSSAKLAIFLSASGSAFMKEPSFSTGAQMLLEGFAIFTRCSAICSYVHVSWECVSWERWIWGSLFRMVSSKAYPPSVCGPFHVKDPSLFSHFVNASDQFLVCL